MKLKFNPTQVATAIASALAMIASVTPMLPTSTPIWVRIALGALGAGLQVWAHAIHSDEPKHIAITQTFERSTDGVEKADAAAVQASSGHADDPPTSSER